jgi:putative ABC transport system ATP-binding protein
MTAEAEAEAVVQVADLRRGFGAGDMRVEALRGVSFEIRPGELVVLRGRSGSGKTTLLNLIAGLDRPTSGTVEVSGKRLEGLGEGALAKWRSSTIGFVFQSYNLLPVLTALENVELPLLLTSLGSAERKKRAQTALRVVGLEDRMQHYPRQLSGGQEQRVAIARAIVNDPTIIVADEPTGDLDRKAADEILTLLDKLNTQLGKTILMVTHDPAAAERAKIIRRLDKGKLVS